MKPRRSIPQEHFGFATGPAALDTDYCASSFCRSRRMQRSTHILTLGRWKFYLCANCARPWESIRWSKVERIKEAAEVAR